MKCHTRLLKSLNAVWIAQIIEDIPHMLAVANKHERQHDWSFWEVATIIFSGAACGQALVRWLLWVGRRREVGPDSEHREPLALHGEE
jgi:hypothetical protein